MSSAKPTTTGLEPQLGGQAADYAPMLTMSRNAAPDDWCMLETTYHEWLGVPIDETDVFNGAEGVRLHGRIRAMSPNQIARGMFVFFHMDSPDMRRSYLMPLSCIRRIWKTRPEWDTTPEPYWWRTFTHDANGNRIVTP